MRVGLDATPLLGPRTGIGRYVAGLAAREVLRYPLTTASLALREVARARHTRRRPPVRPTLLRLRVLGSYARLLPAMLARRRRIAARASVNRRRLERWLVLR